MANSPPVVKSDRSKEIIQQLLHDGEVSVERLAKRLKTSTSTVRRELAELERETEHDRKLEEMGDLLFAVVNLARHLNIEPEAALREANRKFEKRFRAIEQAPGFQTMPLEQKEELWQQAKADQADSVA